MKKLTFAVALCAAAVSFGDGGTGGCKDSCMEAKAAQNTLAENPVKKTCEEATAEARLEAQGNASAAGDDHEAAKQGVTTEELNLQRRAKALGVTVDEFKKMTPEQRRAKSQSKRDEMMAKYLGVTVEELKKLTPEERRAKMTEKRRKYVSERDAKNKARAGEERPADTPKEGEAK